MEERVYVLELLRDGRITAHEAARLLDALRPSTEYEEDVGWLPIDSDVGEDVARPGGVASNVAIGPNNAVVGHGNVIIGEDNLVIGGDGWGIGWPPAGPPAADPAGRLGRANRGGWWAAGRVPRYDLTFHASESPIAEPVTKFGGQPVWLSVPQWPLSRATGELMRFIGQVAIPAALFPASRARMAYVFMTDWSDDVMPATWQPDGGENAVVLQPGAYEGSAVPRGTAPSLYHMALRPGEVLLQPQECEYAVDLRPGSDPYVDVVAHAKAGHSLPPEELDGNKIGGIPYFLENAEYPRGGPWHLLLQLDCTQVPFEVNFGGDGIGYVFLSVDGTSAKLLYQR